LCVHREFLGYLIVIGAVFGLKPKKAPKQSKKYTQKAVGRRARA
jgi:hypothetical protein